MSVSAARPCCYAVDVVAAAAAAAAAVAVVAIAMSLKSAEVCSP